jgi:peptidoglycan/LPS O-acetylase OafA/YrhL
MKLRKRINEIDGLRGIAAVFVMLFHYTFVFNQKWVYGKPFHYGYMGVSLFFIISGFVITMSVESKKSYIDFCYGRFIRLYPIYWIALIITIIAMHSMNLQMFKLNTTNIVVNFTMLQRFLGYIDIDGAYWTLAIELIFYFLIVIILILNKTAKIIPYFIVLILIIFISRIILSQYFTEQIKLIQIIQQFRFLHLFLAGIIFYKIHTSRFQKTDLILLTFCLICNLGAHLRFNILIETLIVLVFFIVFGLLTIKENKLMNFLNHPILQFLGKISFPLYLLNENFGASLFTLINLHFSINIFIQILIVIIIVIISASLIHYTIEKPLFQYLHTKKINKND